MTREELMQRTASNIRRLRKAKGLSQEQLALEAGLNPAFLGHIERCLKCPTIDTLNKIATALEVPLSVLVTFPDEQAASQGNRAQAEQIAAAISTVSSEDASKILEIVLDMVAFIQKSRE
ncbi:MAG: helix-turn-helix domain-containing protein [Clostridiales bacterium]|nr:helix-turn-helix domain-containing protein [Clostridiales bacterium]